ncbi:MAG: transposase [Patescibacteria group bacterium]|jgi:REP element-mobilizing transposase RayT
MSKLRTINIPGHAYFVTTKVKNGTDVFVDHLYCNIIINNLKYYLKTRYFDLGGFVVMPNHVHFMIRPYGEYSISEILRDFKKHTSKQIIQRLKQDKKINRSLFYSSRGGRIQNPAQGSYCGIRNPASALWAQTLLDQFYVNTRKQEFQVWQANNWIKNIYSQEFFNQKVQYIHRNPVRAGYVKTPEEFPYSSACYDIS